MRAVSQVYQTNSQHWVGNGFLVQPLFSHMGENRGTDPFLMLDYASPKMFLPNAGSSERGVGQHPHKGFETVTIAYHGEVAHRDSTGGGGVIKAGDVQWMTAGSGVIHEEFHSKEFSQAGGLFEMVQLWVNLPAKYKNTPARYQHLSKQDIPVIHITDVGYLRIIAGEYLDTKGIAKTFTEMNVWDVVIQENQTMDLPIPISHNLLMVVLHGDVTVNQNQTASQGQLIRFADTDNETQVQITAGSQEVKMLLLSGVPIREPVVGYGPFVMNSEHEIRQAIIDFNSGRFGKI